MNSIQYNVKLFSGLVLADQLLFQLEKTPLRNSLPVTAETKGAAPQRQQAEPLQCSNCPLNADCFDMDRNVWHPTKVQLQSACACKYAMGGGIN